MEQAGSKPTGSRLISANTAALVIVTLLAGVVAGTAHGATLERIRSAGKLTAGYRVDARPFSYQDASGKAIGYSVSLCEKIIEQVKTDLGLSALVVDWVPVGVTDRFSAVAQGRVDFLCAPEMETLGARKEVSFSIGIFPGGIGAVVRADAPPALQEVLLGRPPSSPIWRASPARVLEEKTFSAVGGTTSEKWIEDRLNRFQLPANVVLVDNYDAGIERVLNGDVDVFFGDRSILLDASTKNQSSSSLKVLERLFTEASLALILPRNDDDFRLLADRALSQIFSSGDFADLYTTWFGTPNEATMSFFRGNILPE